MIVEQSGSSIFLEAAQLLESLQDHHHVYGGAIFYQNKYDYTSYRYQINIHSYNFSLNLRLTLVEPINQRLNENQ